MARAASNLCYDATGAPEPNEFFITYSSRI
jgi:hypothetical protein